MNLTRGILLVSPTWLLNWGKITRSQVMNDVVPDLELTGSHLRLSWLTMVNVLYVDTSKSYSCNQSNWHAGKCLVKVFNSVSFCYLEIFRGYEMCFDCGDLFKHPSILFISYASNIVPFESTRVWYILRSIIHLYTTALVHLSDLDICHIHMIA